MVAQVHAQTDLTKDAAVVDGAVERQDYTIALHKFNTKILYSARSDLLTFFLFIKYLKEYGKNDDFMLVEEYAKEFIDKQIDPILKREKLNDDPEVEKLFLELQYLKASLFYECKDIHKACEILKDLDDKYLQDIDIDVGFMRNVFQQKKPYMALTLFRYTCRNQTNFK